MRRRAEIVGYCIVFALAFGLDRLTKAWVLAQLHAERPITSFLTFDFVLNRGISWGMFHSEHEATFWILTLTIIGVLLFLLSFAYHRWQEDHGILGEVLVASGALSNLVDRVVHRGVIDFVVVHWQGWAFPAFNVADMCIVVGVFMMFLSTFFGSDAVK